MAVGDFYTYTGDGVATTTHIASTVTATYIIVGAAQTAANLIRIDTLGFNADVNLNGLVVGGGVVLALHSGGRSVITVLQLT